MEKAKRKRAASPPPADDDAVEVRVSARTPRVVPAASPAARAQNFAMALVETMLGQLADYVENSPAVEKLIQVQTTKVLRELARDPQLAALIRAQAEQYLVELASKPEILEPLVKAQVERTLDTLMQDPSRLQQLAEKIKAGEGKPARTRKPNSRRTKLEIE